MNESKYLFFMDWNWDKIPELEHATLIAHVEAQRWSDVAQLCEQYNVSTYCCCNVQGLQAWAVWAIEKGIIHGDKQSEAMATDAGRDGGTVIG